MRQLTPRLDGRCRTTGHRPINVAAHVPQIPTSKETLVRDEFKKTRKGNVSGEVDFKIYVECSCDFHGDVEQHIV